jgi:16S rRNA (uracil1498-N3)-methyltransferase
MPRFPIKRSQIKNGHAVISGSDYRHIVKVLRLQIGDEITLFDEGGTEHLGKIEEITSKEIMFAIAESKSVKTESELHIHLLQGIPKGDKMDLIIEKTTELGVKTIVPVITERSQVRETKKIMRWQRIAIESSKQCGRVIPTEIHEAISFKKALELKNNSDLRIIFHEKYRVKLNDTLKSFSGIPTDITLFIGPEGGFSEEEAKMAQEKGFIKSGLGPRILRTETAGIVAIAVLQFAYGDI